MAYLFKPSWKTDALAEASAEVGLLFGAVGVLLGSIWGKPTWGVYWTGIPRLTTAAIMLVAYMGYLALRRFVEDPEKRAVWSAVVGIIASVDLPIVWFSVKWWRSLHQVQSTPKTVDPDMVLPLRLNAFAFLALVTLFILHRYRIAMARARRRRWPCPRRCPRTRPQPHRGGGVMSSLMLLAQVQRRRRSGRGPHHRRLGLRLGRLRHRLGGARASTRCRSGCAGPSTAPQEPKE